jgi:hypothetical protein
MSRLAALLG